MSIEKLKKEIKEKQALLDKLVAQEKDVIKPLEDYTIEEKEEFFNKMYSTALSALNQKIESGREDDSDDEHYIWEDIMGLLGKDKQKFWKYWNSLI